MVREKGYLVTFGAKAERVIIERARSELPRLRRVDLREPNVRAQTIGKRGAGLVLNAIDHAGIVVSARAFRDIAIRFLAGRDISNHARVRRPGERLSRIGDEEICVTDGRDQSRDAPFGPGHPDAVLSFMTCNKGDAFAVGRPAWIRSAPTGGQPRSRRNSGRIQVATWLRMAAVLGNACQPFAG